MSLFLGADFIVAEQNKDRYVKGGGLVISFRKGFSNHQSCPIIKWTPWQRNEFFIKAHIHGETR